MHIMFQVTSSHLLDILPSIIQYCIIYLHRKKGQDQDICKAFITSKLQNQHKKHHSSVLMHSIHTGKSLCYLSDIVQPVASRTIRSGLRSAESTDYITPRLNTKFGERSFSHAGPASWNSLPADLRAISDCSCFKSKLKTYRFQLAFNIQ